jgi:hypothetical protein
MKQAKEQPRLYDVFSEISPAVGGVFDVRKIAWALKKVRGRIVERQVPGLSARSERSGRVEGCRSLRRVSALLRGQRGHAGESAT